MHETVRHAVAQIGQRQLLCLARAILRNSTIVFLDEPTANVDYDTDQKIQRAIRTAFTHSTVVTIAHRLATIIDGDYVMVMDKGVLGEFGRPHDLLQRDGPFAALVAESGPNAAARLRHIAATTAATAGKSLAPLTDAGTHSEAPLL